MCGRRIVAERGAVGPRDGIVVIELAIDRRSGWEIPALVGCIRAGAAALALMPFRGSDVTGMLHARNMAKIGTELADEIEVEARDVQAKREAFYRAESKAKK